MTKEELKTDESKYIIELVIKDKLKKEAEEWLCNNLHSASEEDFIKAMVDIAEPREKRIEELEAEVKEWKDKADLWCNTANLKDHNIMINKELEKENAELKSENQKWKDEWQEQVQKATDEGYARTLQTIQLSKAKDIIREFVEWATWQGSNCPNFKSIQDKAEQFLSEVEK